MSRYLLSIGSNIRPEHHLPSAIQALRKYFSVLKLSSIYETAPCGPAGQNLFWNMTAEIDTPKSEKAVFQILKEIEKDSGRIRDPKNKYAPRTLDLDLLFQKEDYTRPFIMIPLAEMMPGQKDILTGKTFLELSESFKEEKKNYRVVKSGKTL